MLWRFCELHYWDDTSRLVSVIFDVFHISMYFNLRLIIAKITNKKSIAFTNQMFILTLKIKFQIFSLRFNNFLNIMDFYFVKYLFTRSNPSSLIRIRNLTKSINIWQNWKSSKKLVLYQNRKWPFFTCQNNKFF